MAAEDRLMAELLAFAHRLANAAGAVVMPHYLTGIPASDKSDGGRFDDVTAADRAVEEAMRGLIDRAYPVHGVIGEEFGTENSGAELLWVLDPIDGTKSFLSTIALFGTMIGLLHGGEPLTSLSDYPVLRKRFWGDCHDTSIPAEVHVYAVLQTGLDIYDIAAAVPIVIGAGGILTGLDGGAATQSGAILAYGDPALRAELLPVLALADA